MYQGRLDLARKLVEESDEIHDRTGHVWGRAQTIGTLGAIRRDEGDEQRALPLVEQSAALALEAGVPWWQGGMLAEHAALSLNAGELDEAERRARESLAIADELRDRAGRVFGVGLLATVAAERGQAERAGRLWGAIEDDDALAPLGGWRRHREECEAKVKNAAGPEFDSGYAEGRDLDLDDAVSLALEGD